MDYGYRPNVQIAIKDSILGIFQIFTLEKIFDLISFISSFGFKFKKDH